LLLPIPFIAYAAVIAATPLADLPAPPAQTAAQPAPTAVPDAAAAPAPTPAAQPAASAPRPAPDLSGPIMQDIIVVGPPSPTPQDPFAHTNVEMFKVVRGLDGAITEPAALAFGHVVPSPVRTSLRNVFNNLDEPVIAANFLLQLHPGKALETVARFVLNSTIGWAGLFDVAGQHYIGLPRRANGFADTLGYYGVKSGAYLYLPLIGPTSPRDLLGGAVDMAGAPLRWIGGPFKTLAWQVPTTTFTALDTRLEFQHHLEVFREGEHGIYVSEREWYLRLRAARIAAHKAGDHGPPVDDVPSIAAPDAPASATVPAKP